MIQMNLLMKQKQSHRHRGQTHGCQGGGREGRGGMDWESEISRCKLSHIQQINNKGLPCCTGTALYPVINCNRKECVCVYLCVCVCTHICACA